MVIVVVIVAAVTVIISAALISAAISVRPTTPCFFDNTIVYVGESRIDGGACTGKPDNVYVTGSGPTRNLNGTRICNGHVSQMLDLADALVR